MMLPEPRGVIIWSVHEPAGGAFGDLGRAWSAYRRSPLQLIAIAALLLPLNLIYLLGAWAFLLIIVQIILGALIHGALVHASWTALSGQTPSVGASLAATRDRAGWLVEFTFRYLGAALGLMITLVGIPFAIRIFVRWFLGIQAIMVRGLDAKTAIGSSCGVVSGRWWYVAGLLFVVFLVFGAPGLSLNIAWPSSPVVRIGTAIWGVVTAPLIASFWTSMFMRLEERPPEEATSAEGLIR